jgi:hypothetical protein
MARKDLLPGISADDCPPVAVFDSRRAINRARFRAVLRDAAQLLLLVGVDWLFVRWPYAHVPSFDRAHSVLIVALLNAAVLTHVAVTRAFPRWSAQRIARTWCLSERAWFFQR